MTWQMIIEPMSVYSGAVVTVGANFLLQSTVLIGMGLILVRALRSKGAAVQSICLRVTLGAAIGVILNGSRRRYESRLESFKNDQVNPDRRIDEYKLETFDGVRCWEVTNKGQDGGDPDDQARTWFTDTYNLREPLKIQFLLRPDIFPAELRREKPGISTNMPDSPLLVSRKILAQIEGLYPPIMSAETELPTTYLFETVSHQGILQIVSVSKDTQPETMRRRYKLTDG